MKQKQNGYEHKINCIINNKLGKNYTNIFTKKVFYDIVIIWGKINK